MTFEIIRDLPFDEYLKIDAINATLLKAIDAEGSYYAKNAREKDNDTPAKRLGRACHTAILEPHLYDELFMVYDGTRRGKQWEAAQEKAASTGAEVLTQKEAVDVASVSAAVNDHKNAADLIIEGGEKEITIIWTHPRTGAKCKSRIDVLGCVLADLKTATRVRGPWFPLDCAKFRYDMQLAFYQDAAALAGFGSPPVKVVAAQNRQPFDVRVWNAPDPFLQEGRFKYESAIDLWLACEACGDWSDPDRYTEEDLWLPEWAKAQYNQEITFGGDAVSFQGE